MNRVEKKVTAAVNKCVDWLSVVLFLIIFILALCQICMRYVLNKPLVWSEELIRYAFVWICYLGWVLGTRNRSHIQITIIVNLLPTMSRTINRMKIMPMFIRQPLCPHRVSIRCF